MRIKFIRIDASVNKINISIDNGKNWESFPIDDTVRENLLVNGYSLDEVKSKPGFDINKIIVSVNDGTSCRKRLEVVIEPDLSEMVLKRVNYSHTMADGTKTEENVVIKYSGNLSLLNKKYDLLEYLTYGTIVEKPFSEDDTIKEEHYYFDNLDLPNTGESFLYAEVENAPTEFLPGDLAPIIK